MFSFSLIFNSLYLFFLKFILRKLTVHQNLCTPFHSIESLLRWSCQGSNYISQSPLLLVRAMWLLLNNGIGVEVTLQASLFQPSPAPPADIQRIRRWRTLRWKDPDSLNHCVEESCAQTGMPTLEYTSFFS